MRYQMEIHLSQLMDELQLDERSVSAELGINLAHVKRLRNDDWSTIKRTDLQKLMCWGRKHGRDMLTIADSPIWRTFPNTEVVLFRGRDQSNSPLPSDSHVEGRLLEELKAQSCSVTAMPASELGADDIKARMRSQNCIFIGSPKYNLASEYCLAALWKVKPCDDGKANQERTPFHFVWEGATPTGSAFSRRRTSAGKCGLYVSTSGAAHGTRKNYWVAADWKPHQEYRKWTGNGRDAGVCVICYRPCGTDKEVTSIVLCGFSGFATLDMAVDLVSDGLRVDGDDVTPGKPVMRVLATRYRKASARADSRVRISKGRRWYGPPWTQLVTE